MKRQLSELEKQTVIQQQLSLDGCLKCFISGEVITDQDEIEYDHIQPYSRDGETSTINMRVVLKKDLLQNKRLYLSHLLGLAKFNL